MWLFEISIVIFKFFIYQEPTRLIESLSDLIQHMHMQVDAINCGIVDYIFL